MDNQQPQLSPDEQLFLKKKQLFMYSVLQAVSNGLSACDGVTEDQFRVILAEFGNTDVTKSDGGVVDYLVRNSGYKSLIFSHEFLKAFFGEQYFWEHGSAMLKMEQPLFYLEQYLQPVKPSSEWK